MAASTAGLDAIEIDIAPGANPSAGPETFVWQRAGRRRTSADIVITVGRDDESAEVEAGSLSVVMDDRDGNLSPRNVYGTWYGALKRGTPIRVRWPRVTDTFARTVASGWGSAPGTPSDFAWSVTTSSGSPATSTSSNRAVFTSSAANDSVRNVLTGAGSRDVELLWAATVPVAPTGANLVVAGIARHADNSNYVRAHVEYAPGGSVSVRIQKRYLGVTSDLFPLTATGLTFAAGDTFWTRMRTEGSAVLVRTWKDGTTEPATWQGAGIENDLEYAGVGLLLWRINTNVGSFVTYVDNFSVTNVLWSGNVPEWPVRWPNKAGRAESTTPLAAAGIMRRLQQGSSALISPLRRQLSGRTDGWAYFPAEDSSGATAAASGLSGGKPAVVENEYSFAGDDTLPGAATSLVLNKGQLSRLTGTIPKAGQNQFRGFSALMFFRCDTPVTTEQILADIKVTGGSFVSTWRIYINATVIGFRGLDNLGNELAGNSATYASNFDLTEWMALQLETSGGSGPQTVSLVKHQVGSTAYFANTTSVAGVAGFLSGFKIAAVNDSMSVGHVWFGSNDLPFVDDTFSLVSNGYVGEMAADRIDRLGAETQTPSYAMTGASEPMGRQRAAALIDLLRECEEADQGVLSESGNSLVYRPRSRRYNPPVALALDWAAGHLDDPPEPQDDDQRLRNQWTVSRVDGSSATVTDENGPLGTSEVGLYDDQLDVNIRDDFRLTDFAGWLVDLGTQQELRWPRIKINLVAHPELIPAWLACGIGSRVTVANPPSQIAGESIDLVIEGYTQTINVDTWTVEMSCSPARPWLVGTYGSSASVGSCRYDSPSTTLTSQVAASGTTLTLQYNLPSEGWTQKAASYPLDLMIAGERVTIPAAANMGAPSGTGPYTQVASSVVRGVNGINKTLPAGAEVHVATPGRYAL